eukprot:1188153-Prorocentrum_minimum.AAC.3
MRTLTQVWGVECILAVIGTGGPELIGRLYLPTSLKECSFVHPHENDPKNLHLKYVKRGVVTYTYSGVGTGGEAQGRGGGGGPGGDLPQAGQGQAPQKAKRTVHSTERTLPSTNH